MGPRWGRDGAEMGPRWGQICSSAGSIARGNHTRFFDHEHGAPNRHDGPVQHASRDGVSLPRAKLDGLGRLELDAELTVQDRKNSSCSSCLCQWNSPSITPRRTRTSPTCTKVWLYQVSSTLPARPHVDLLQGDKERLIVDGVLGRHGTSSH